MEMNKLKKSLSSMQSSHVTKFATGGALMAIGTSANAADLNLSQIGEQIATSVGQFVGIITAIGMAGIGVVVLATAFKMAFSFVRSLR